MRRTVGELRGELGLAGTVVSWATAFPAIRVGLEGYSPWALGLLRLLVAALVLAVVGLLVRPVRPRGRQWWRVIACGLLGQTLYQGLLMTGEVSVPAGTASVLITTAPIFSVLAASLFLRERIGARWKGFLVAFAGAALVGASLGVGGGLTALVVLAAALCQGLYHVAVKPLAEQLGALSATIWSLWAGAILALPAAPALISDSRSASGSSLLAAIFLGVVPSALGYLVWSDALTRSTVARSTIALYLVPVVAMALSWWWLGERPTVLAVFGGAIAVAGVIIVRRTAAVPPRPVTAKVVMTQ
ncbi:MAG: DMT family transporter [Actinomycetota bacterium]|nr:DMT family transporter [Actinomycetota bacterium]